MLPWIESPTITIDLDLPPKERYAQVPAHAIAMGRKLVEDLRGELPRGALLLGDLLRMRTHGRFHDEAVACAELVGESWRLIMLAAASYDLALSSYGCSTVALATQSGPVLARNMDWWPEQSLARASYLVRMERKGLLQFASAGWPGSIGVVSGLSTRGFAIVLNAAFSVGGIDKLGYPVLLHIRRVLEDATDFDDAVDRLASERLAAGCLLTVVGRENQQRVVIERSQTDHAIRRPEGDEAIAATNHYRALHEKPTSGAPDMGDVPCGRYHALLALLGDHEASDEITDDRLLYTLTDEQIKQEITAQHVIIRPRRDSIRLFVPRRLMPDQTPA